MVTENLARASVLALLAGCSFEPVFTAKMVDYNRIAEDTGNSVMLLNVLRGRDRKPFYFTQIASFTPQITSQLILGGSIPLNPLQYTTLTLSPSGNITSSNSAAVGVEATMNFTQGITRPILPALFDYYWQRGWPRSMLLNMFLQKIEVVQLDGSGKPLPNAPVRVYFNGPSWSGRAPPDSELDCKTNSYNLGQSRAQFRCFQRLLRALEPVLRFTDEKDSTEIALPAPPAAAPLSNWKTLFEAAKLSGFELRTKKGTYTLFKETSYKRLCIVDPEVEPDVSAHRRSSRFKCAQPQTAKQKPGEPKARAPEPVAMFQATYEAAAKAQRLSPPVQDAYSELRVLCGAPKCEFHFHLRSPEAMIYYLGEIVRAQSESSGVFNVLIFDARYSDGGTIPPNCVGRDQEGRYFMALFRLGKGVVPPSNAEASVRYEGEAYFVPQGGCQASMQALTLVQQVFALQRDSKDLPVVTTIVAR